MMNTEMILTPGSIEDFRKSLSARGVSPQTVKAYMTDLRILREWVEPGDLVEDFATTVSAWLNDTRAEVSPATTRRRLSSAKALAKWAGNPVFLLDYRLPPLGLRRPHPLPEGKAGVLTMIAHASSTGEAALVALQGLCGLRVSEARTVVEMSFDSIERTLTVRGKGDKERTIPVPDEAWNFLAGACREAKGAPLVNLSDRGARKAITRLGEVCGFSRPISSHDLRATFATDLLRRTNNLRLVQEILGHANVKSTEFYTQVTLDDMRREMQ